MLDLSPDRLALFYDRSSPRIVLCGYADGFEDIFIAAGMGFGFRYGINSVLELNWPSGKKQTIAKDIPVNRLFTNQGERLRT